MQHFRMAALTLLVLAVAGSAPAAAQNGKKVPIPSKKERDKAVVLIGELYKQEIDVAAKAVPPNDRIENAKLASIFLNEARSTNDYPAGRYELLYAAVTRALLGGQPQTALEAIDEMDLYFALPPGGVMEKKIEALLDASKQTASPDAYQNVIHGAEDLIGVAESEDDYPSALKLIEAADVAARKRRDVPQVTKIRKERERILDLDKKFARWKPYAEALSKNADDAQANLAMGVYQSLIKGSWDKGLPLLAKATSVPSLKRAAEIDLDDPSATKKQMALAQAWFDLAQKNPVPKLLSAKEFDDSGKIQLLLRSYHWYLDALSYQNGKERDSTELILRKITELLPPEYAVGELTKEFWKWELNSGPIYCAAFSPDSKKIATVGADGVLRIFDVQSLKQLRQIEGMSGRMWTVCFSSDSRRVITGGFDGSIRLWDVVSGREVRRYAGHKDYVRSVAASRDGKYILSGGDDRMVRLWDEIGGKEIRVFPGHDNYVWCVDLSRDGSQGLSASLDKTIRLWDIGSGKQLKELRGHKDTVLSVVFTPSGRSALSGSTDGTLILWNLESDQHLVFKVPASKADEKKKHTSYVNSVAVSPDGRRAISGGQDRTVRLWDLHTGEQLRVLKSNFDQQTYAPSDPQRAKVEAHRDQVWHVAFSPDGRLAVSCGQDGTVRLWSGSKYR